MTRCGIQAQVPPPREQVLDLPPPPGEGTTFFLNLETLIQKRNEASMGITLPLRWLDLVLLLVTTADRSFLREADCGLSMY